MFDARIKGVSAFKGFFGLLNIQGKKPSILRKTLHSEKEKLGRNFQTEN